MCRCTGQSPAFTYSHLQGFTSTAFATWYFITIELTISCTSSCGNCRLRRCRRLAGYFTCGVAWIWSEGWSCENHTKIKGILGWVNWLFDFSRSRVDGSFDMSPFWTVLLSSENRFHILWTHHVFDRCYLHVHLGGILMFYCHVECESCCMLSALWHTPTMPFMRYLVRSDTHWLLTNTCSSHIFDDTSLSFRASKDGNHQFPALWTWCFLFVFCFLPLN